MTNIESAIWLSDMSKCLPSAALSTTRQKHHWQLLDYEAEGVKGVMLHAGPETSAPDVVLPLNLQGWYAVYIGTWLAGRSDTGWGRSTQGADNMGSIKVRLEGDPCFSVFRREKPNRTTLEEVFWKCADLSDQNVVIGQQQEGFRNDASVAYVRLVPLSTDQVADLLHDRAQQDTKRLIATNDAFGIFFRGRITTKEGIWEHVEPYRNTDFSKLFWEIVSGMYGGWRAGDALYGAGVQDFPRTGDRNMAESYQALRSKGINPLKTAMDHAHSMGLEFHISQRAEMFQTGPPFEEIYTTAFYREHPELRIVDRDGTPITGLSYAYPSVRNYLISLLAEAASLGADGVAMIYPRSGPYLLYEPPVMAGFAEHYGVDPRELAESDERLRHYRAGFMTQFMRELRQAMDRVGAKLGRRLEVSAITFATRDENWINSLDPATWIAEELIDNLIPYPCRADHSYLETDLDEYVRVTAGTPCKLYVNLMPRHMPSQEYRRKALACYRAGADGLFFWDTYQRHDATAQWPTIRRLGHLEELEAWARTEEHEQEPRLIRLLSLGGHSMGRYSPYRGA